MTERTRRLLDSYTDYLLVFFGQATATGLAALLPQARSSHPVPIGSSVSPAVHCTKQVKEIVGRLVENIPEVPRIKTDSDLIADIATRLEITEADVILCYKEVSHVYGKKVIYSDILKVVYKLPEVIKRTPTVADVVGTFEVYKRRELPERRRQEAERSRSLEKIARINKKIVKAQQLATAKRNEREKISREPMSPGAARGVAQEKRHETAILAQKVAEPEHTSVSTRDFNNPTHRRW